MRDFAEEQRRADKELLDKFAMAAMQAIVSDPMTRGVKDKAREIAESAYAVARAMMKERAK